jgi:hypothetical protein
MTVPNETSRNGKDEEVDLVISEGEFKELIANHFVDPILLGLDKDNKKLFLSFDLSAQAIDPRDNHWKVVSLWFRVTDEKGESKFTIWKQPEIHPWKDEKDFSLKVKTWMNKKFRIARYNRKAPVTIMNRIQAIEDAAKKT